MNMFGFSFVVKIGWCRFLPSWQPLQAGNHGWLSSGVPVASGLVSGTYKIQ
jgi:hypothetical protein